MAAGTNSRIVDDILAIYSYKGKSRSQELASFSQGKLSVMHETPQTRAGAVKHNEIALPNVWD